MPQLEAPARSVKVALIESPARMPTHLFAWLPIVWTRVLFPGQAPPLQPWCWPALVLLAVASGLLLYPCMAFHLFEPDEGRYAQIPREMLTTGEWIVPTLQGQPYLDKPPLFYWLVMLSYAIFGYHDWAARFIPALAMHATVLTTFALGRRVVGDRAAFWGALLLTTSPFFLGVGRLLVLDGLLTLFVTLALLAIYCGTTSRFWWGVAAVACGFGVLTKGPVAIVLVVVPFLTHCVLTRGSVSVSWRGWLGFVSIVLAINLPWYVAIAIRQPRFAAYFLLQHNIERFADPFDHVRPLWFYVPIVALGLLPAIVFAWPSLRFLISTRPGEAERRCVGLGYLLLASGWCIGFFSLAGSKLPTYVLPAFPPLCLALGCFVARTSWQQSRWLVTSIAGGWLLLACSHYVVIPAYARHRSPLKHEDVQTLCSDPSVPVVCFPRHVDSAAFYVGRADFRTYRSKEIGEAVQYLSRQPRTVVLFGHRNSPETLARHLPAHVRITERRPLGLCEMVIVECEP